MTVWLVGRSSDAPGGDALQMQEAAAVLTAAGLVAECAPATVQPSAGDTVLLHNLQRCLEWGDLPERARAAGSRVVLVPLFHDLTRYHAGGRQGLDGAVARVLPARVHARIRGRGRSPRRRGARLLGEADAVLLAHEAERALLRAHYGVDAPRATVVPIVIPRAAAGAKAPPGDFVASVGRVEPLKDSLGVVRACRDLALPLWLVGSPSETHPKYAEATLGEHSLSGGWQPGALAYPAARTLLGRARVHALASWAEVLGRVTFEAAIEGAAVVHTTAGHGAACLAGLGPPEGLFLVEPGDGVGLRRALAGAWERGRPGVDGPLAQRVRDHFTWEAAGPTLVEALR